jgi:hypothetical protein
VLAVSRSGAFAGGAAAFGGGSTGERFAMATGGLLLARDTRLVGFDRQSVMTRSVREKSKATFSDTSASTSSRRAVDEIHRDVSAAPGGSGGESGTLAISILSTSLSWCRSRIPGIPSSPHRQKYDGPPELLGTTSTECVYP